VRIDHDKISGALYIKLREGEYDHTEDFSEEADVYLDVDAEGYVLGLEALSFEDLAQVIEERGGKLAVPERVVLVDGRLRELGRAIPEPTIRREEATELLAARFRETYQALAESNREALEELVEAQQEASREVVQEAMDAYARMLKDTLFRYSRDLEGSEKGSDPSRS
jgi:uncharacterized protein YuzE